MPKKTQLPPLKADVKTETPIIVKVTAELDIVVRVRNEQIPQLKPNFLPIDSELGGSGCPGNKFSYSFEKDNASVLSLIVEEFKQDNPDDAGEFTSCINDPSSEPKVRVIGFAKEHVPGGRVSLTLKFLDKDVFSKPKEFTSVGDGFLKLHELIKLPNK